jgi:hypothetical protein
MYLSTVNGTLEKAASIVWFLFSFRGAGTHEFSMHIFGMHSMDVHSMDMHNVGVYTLQM